MKDDDRYQLPRRLDDYQRYIWRVMEEARGRGENVRVVIPRGRNNWWLEWLD